MSSIAPSDRISLRSGSHRQITAAAAGRSSSQRKRTPAARSNKSKSRANSAKKVRAGGAKEVHRSTEGVASGDASSDSDTDPQVDRTITAAAIAANTAAAAMKTGQTSGSVPDVTLVQALMTALHAAPQRSPHGSSTRAVSSAASNAPREAFRDKYAGAPGLALSAWSAKARRMLAFYDDLSDARAVAWLATGLEGAAGDWFDQYVAIHHSPPPSPDALMAALRSRFQPVNAAETARRELDVLTQGEDSVNEYTSRFLQLVAHLPDLSKESRMFQYRRGLHDDTEDRLAQTEPQPSTLEATIALAARIEGRRTRSRGTDGFAAASTTTVDAASNSHLLSRIAELEALVRTLQSTNGGSRTSRRDENRQQVVGLSTEEARRRMDSGLCLYCGRSDHIVRTCPDKAQMKPPTLTA